MVKLTVVGSGVRVAWFDPLSGRLTATGQEVEVEKWSNGKWQFERTITEGASRNYSWHLGLDSGSYYSYRVRAVCGTTKSTWSGWSTVSPWSGASGADDSGGPQPTPGPNNNPSRPKNDEAPPPPLN